jgi:hypothetical protein
MFMAASLCAVMIACSMAPSAEAKASDYGTPTQIDIAPGMMYTYKPTFPAGLTVTTVIHEQGPSGGTGGTWGTFSGGTLVVNIPSSATPGSTYDVVLKCTSENPHQEIFIPITFTIVENAAVSGSHQNIVLGSSVSMTPTVTGMGTFTWSVTEGKTLPDGLSLDTATGKVTGTPTKLGTNTIYLTATSSFGEPENLVVSFEVVPVLAVTNSPSAGAIAYVVG